jgi:threonine dehydrogenase-like Zn-dependent dehydrogenase
LNARHLPGAVIVEPEVSCMRGLVVEAGTPDAAHVVYDLPDPDPAEGEVLVEGLAAGVCATDRDIVAGRYGTAPGHDGPGGELVLCHESLGRVISDESGIFAPGDLVTGIARRPDPVPCPNCEVGEWDMCRNGLYVECGIKQRHGFARERWRIEAGFAIRIDPALGPLGVLIEPASVVTKAWEHIERIGHRARWAPHTVLITGAGPIGLLAALLGVQRGLSVHVVDRATDGPKPELVRGLGGVYHVGHVSDTGITPDVLLECTGADSMVVEVLSQAGPGGIVCLTGVTADGDRHTVDLGQANRDLVLENTVVFGSASANRRHWQAAADALLRADPEWLASLITRRVPLERFQETMTVSVEDVKVVLDLTS